MSISQKRLEEILNIPDEAIDISELVSLETSSNLASHASMMSPAAPPCFVKPSNRTLVSMTMENEDTIVMTLL